jgi:REP-associated tyrosine transposase
VVGYRRNFVPGGTFFFTVTFADRRSSALVEYIAELRIAFRVARSERPFAIDAIVVLPDHLHTIMTLPPEDSDFSGRWRRIKSVFTRRVAAKDKTATPNLRGEYALWQRRFWEHTVRDEIDFAQHVDYIHYNPVKHGLVSCAHDWPYSSFHRYVRRGLLAKDWGGDVNDVGRDFGERQV